MVNPGWPHVGAVLASSRVNQFARRSAERPIHFIVSEHTQYTNLGDIVLNKVLIEQLALRGSIISIGNGERPPPALEQVLQRLAHRRLTWPTFLKYILGTMFDRHVRVLCLNPGGYRGDLAVRNYINAMTYAAARLFGVRLLRIGFSLGPLTERRRRLERLQARLFDVCAVRDRTSLAELAESARSRVRLLPDLALMATDIGSPAGAANPRPLLLISLREGDGERFAMYHRLSEALQQLADEHHLRLVFVAQVKRDAAHLQALARSVASEFRMLDTDDPDVLTRLNELYSAAAILVTNRMHAGIFAAMNGCIPAALIRPAHDLKIVGVMQDARLDGLVHDEADPAALVGKLRTILADREMWEARLARLTRLASGYGRRRIDRLLRPLLAPPESATHA